MHPATTTITRKNRGQASCDRCSSSDDTTTESTRLQQQRSTKTSTTSATRRRRKRLLPKVWTALAFSSALLSSPTAMRSSVHAFQGKLPAIHSYSGRALLAGSSKESNAVGVGPLHAINSRELRILNGMNQYQQHQQHPSRRKERPHSNQARSSSTGSSIPEVLASSMANYFFSSGGGSVKLGSLLAHEQEDALRQEHQLSFATTTTTTAISSSSSLISSSNTATTSTTVVQTTSTSSSVLSPETQSLLLSQQTFRANVVGGAKNNADNGVNRRSGNDEDQKISLNDETFNGHSISSVSSASTDSAVNGGTVMTMDSGSRRSSSNADDSDGLSSPQPSRGKQHEQYPPPRQGYGYSIQLTDDERDLFQLLRKVHEETKMTTTLRVAGGWVRDKLLATPEFQIFHHYKYAGQRLTSKFKPSASAALRSQEQPSMGRQGTKVLLQDEDQGPVDIDIALDTMLGREFADHLNGYLQDHGKDTVSVGVVLKNPEKSKHLETATMQVGSFWVDFVNLRAEEYAEDSRIPDLMRIGTASEDSFRRDLTINSLFYNINTGQVEDWTGRGFTDLRRGVVTTPLTPLTTLLDDPLRVLRSIRFAARLRFTMDDELVASAKDDRVRKALAQKVSRERVGGEVDLMLRSPDPVGAMKLLVNLNLISTVFPLSSCLQAKLDDEQVGTLFDQCHNLLTTTHDHLFDCKVTPPVWCQSKRLLTTCDVEETTLTNDDEARRLLWYASFLKPIHDVAERAKQQQMQKAGVSKRAGKKANRSIMSKLLIDELKRPGRDAEAVEKIMKAADDITKLIQSGCDLSATLILLSDVRVMDNHGILISSMRGRSIDSVTEEDPVWEHAMEFRLLCSSFLQRVGGLWRAALMLSLSEQLATLNEGELEYAIEGDVVSPLSVFPYH